MHTLAMWLGIILEIKRCKESVMKKFISVLVCLAFVFGSYVLVEGAFYGSETLGHVVYLEEDILHIVGEGITPGGRRDVLVNIAGSPIYDLRTGFPVSAAAIYEGMSVRAAYAVERSEPFEGLAVWLNWDFDDAAVFSVVVSGNIQYGADSCVFLSHDEKYRVTIFPETVIMCPRFGQLAFSDIVPGQEFFVWVDMITASSPAEVFPDKIVLLD